MVRLVCSGNPRFQVDERECRREVPATGDTLAELRTELGDEQPLCLLMGRCAGSDDVVTLGTVIRAEPHHRTATGFRMDAGQLPTALA
jgi:nicotinic acid mononucleotide adenylyltransferase